MQQPLVLTKKDIADATNARVAEVRSATLDAFSAIEDALVTHIRSAQKRSDTERVAKLRAEISEIDAS